MKTVGSYIKEKRIEAGYKHVVNLSEACGLDRHVIYDLENDNWKRPCLRTLAILSFYIGIDINMVALLLLQEEQ